MTSNDSYSESNISLYTKENNRKTTSGFFPLLKYKENLYNSCHSKFSKFLNRSNDIKLLINNKMNKKISLNDFIINSYNNLYENKLTPIPYINKRKLKNNLEKKELKNFQRNVVFMRRLEYTNKMNEKKIKKKYKNKERKIIILQKVIRGYLVRKVMYQINIIKETLANFFYSIRFCIMKKYFYIFFKIFDNDNTHNSEEKICYNYNLNIDNENIAKKSSNDLNNNEYDSKDDNKNKIQIEKNIEKPKDIYYVEFDILKEKKDIFKNEKSNNKKDKVNIQNKFNCTSIEVINQNNQKRNRNPGNDLLDYQLSNLSSFNNLKRTKSQTIQRQFRKYLSKKGYYGKFDKRKIAIIYLIKYMVINNIKLYILSILKSLYKEATEFKATQEENYFNMSTERIDTLNRNYLAAITELS